MDFEGKRLTNKQANSLVGGKPWTEKKDFLIKRIRSFGFKIEEKHLQWFMESFVPKELKRISIKRAQDIKTGVLKTAKTPTDVKGGFDRVTNPIVGRKYHVSWAYSGAVFVLKKVDGEHAYLDNKKNKRKEYLMVKVSDLRHLRKNSKQSI